jgi:uncharacterized membrane protein (DUF4010 family)
MSGLATYLVGALVYYEHFWIATALSVASLLLLELKVALETLATRTAPQEILTFAKFLLLTAVILPTLPNQEFGRFHINLLKTWLVVVAVSTISYGSYVLQKVTKESGGVVLAAFLGGAYSSTVTTVAMSRRAAREHRPHLFAGGILIASGVMYLRLVALLTLFNRQLGAMLAPAFLVLAAVAIGTGWFWSRRPDAQDSEIKRESEPGNPLELFAAFLFALFFLGMLVATQLAVTYLGRAGVNILAAIMGVNRCRSFHHGDDPGRRQTHPASSRRHRRPDRRRQQQPDQRHLLLQPSRQENRHSKPPAPPRPSRRRLSPPPVALRSALSIRVSHSAASFCPSDQRGMRGYISQYFSVDLEAPCFL